MSHARVRPFQTRLKTVCVCVCVFCMAQRAKNDTEAPVQIKCRVCELKLGNASSCMNERLAEQVGAVPSRFGCARGHIHVESDGPDGITRGRLVNLTVARRQQRRTHLRRGRELAHVGARHDAETLLVPTRLVEALYLTGREGENITNLAPSASR
jgi:hypothetical protein